MTEGRATVPIAGTPPQKTESTLVTARLTEEGVLTMSAWNHKVGTEKNAEKEIRIGKGPRNYHLLEKGAQNGP